MGEKSARTSADYYALVVKKMEIKIMLRVKFLTNLDNAAVVSFLRYFLHVNLLESKNVTGGKS